MLLEAVTRDTKLCRSLAGKDSVPPGTYNCIAYTTGIKNVWIRIKPSRVGICTTGGSSVGRKRLTSATRPGS